MDNKVSPKVKVKAWHAVCYGYAETTYAMEVPGGIIFRHKCHDGGESDVSTTSMVFVPAPIGYLDKWLSNEK